MKKNIIVPMIAIAMLGMAQAQNVTQNTLITRPGPGCGQDANIARNTTPAVCNWENQNYGSDISMRADAWTYSALGCGSGVFRSLIDFPDLDLVPTGAVVVSATLRLYGPTSTGIITANSQLSGSNDGWIQRITSTWAENTVTWNTQPSVTTVNQVTVPGTSTVLGYNVALNVTAMVQDMVNLTPANRFGFRFMLQNENYYRALVFFSSDYGTLSLRPELEVVYTYSCGGGTNPPTGIASPVGDDMTNSNLAPVNDINQLQVYPNPSSGSFTLDFKNAVKTEAAISIVNSLGQVVKQTTYMADEGANRYILDLSGFAKGNYNISIVFANTALAPLHKQIMIE